MEIKVPKTVQLLPLQEYDPENAELAGVGIFVWVDPPRSVLAEFDQINRDYGNTLNALVKTNKANAGKKPKPRLFAWLDLLHKNRSKDFKPVNEIYRQKLHAWYSRIWSQGTEVTHLSVAELNVIEERSFIFMEWLCRSTWVLIEEHRAAVKKGLRPLEPKPSNPETPAT